MPCGRAHSTHALCVLKRAIEDILKDKDIFHNNEFVEYLKIGAMGPDPLAATDWRLFVIQHKCSPKEFFNALIIKIKENNLQNDPQVMAILYGHLAHYVLDATLHPYIYYISAGSGLKFNGELIKGDYVLDWHVLFENWFDRYAPDKFMPSEYQKQGNSFYSKLTITDRKLILMLNEIYMRIYRVPNVGFKYVPAYVITVLFDKVKNFAFTGNFPVSTIFGNIQNDKDKVEKVQLILDKNPTFIHPVTGIEGAFDMRKEWEKAVHGALELFDDVSKVLFDGKNNSLNYNSYDNSYNTGLPSTVPIELTYGKGLSELYEDDEFDQNEGMKPENVRVYTEADLDSLFRNKRR